jgi:hypothetical protein
MPLLVPNRAGIHDCITAPTQSHICAIIQALQNNFIYCKNPLRLNPYTTVAEIAGTIDTLRRWLSEKQSPSGLLDRWNMSFQIVNEPTGWATLTVDTADPKLHIELDGVILNLERIAVLESEPSLPDCP